MKKRSVTIILLIFLIKTDQM